MKTGKASLNTRSNKIAFLVGLHAGTRSLNELVDLPVIFNDMAKLEKASASSRYADGTVLFWIPENGRDKIN